MRNVQGYPLSCLRVLQWTGIRPIYDVLCSKVDIRPFLFQKFRE
jgi:hypothetical protein